MRSSPLQPLPLSGLFALGAATPGLAQSSEDIHLTASDASIFARHGFSTSVHGNRVLVGALRYSRSGVATGAVHVFDVPFDISQPGTIHIQHRFRNSAPRGSGTNLSNALTP